ALHSRALIGVAAGVHPGVWLFDVWEILEVPEPPMSGDVQYDLTSPRFIFIQKVLGINKCEPVCRPVYL
ncbi:hypothetical protein ABFV57_29320, partial [Pseudomonas neuropathica]|uniref:hypothetical protein n=1 Tax=Pseudomonas neuropathica TaxID=2730425 RepID=UPI0034D74971